MRKVSKYILYRLFRPIKIMVWVSCICYLKICESYVVLPSTTLFPPLIYLKWANGYLVSWDHKESSNILNFWLKIFVGCYNDIFIVKLKKVLSVKCLYCHNVTCSFKPVSENQHGHHFGLWHSQSLPSVNKACCHFQDTFCPHCLMSATAHSHLPPEIYLHWPCN